MADSYAVQPGDTVAASGGEMVPVRAGTQGGGQGFGLSLAPGVDTRGLGKDLQTILKLGEKIFAPQIKKEQEAQFAQGMYRVAQGEAVADIEKEQSSWTDIYGPNFVVEGARVGDAQSRASVLAAEAEGKMADLATQGPKAMQEWYTGRVKELSRGEDDALFIGAAMKEAPTVFKQHAKLHYRHLQDTADTADRTMLVTEFGRYEGMLREAKADPQRYSEADLAEAGWKVVDALTPNPGQNPLSKQKNVVDAITALATSGNFHAIQAMKQGLGGDKSIKVFDGLDPKVRDNLERTIQVEGARWNWRSATDDTLVEVAQLYGNSHLLDVREYAAEIDKINANHAARTGIEAPLISNSEAVQHVLANQREGARMAAQQAKVQAEIAQAQEAAGLLQRPGGMAILQARLKRGELKDDAFQSGEQQVWGQADMNARIRLLNTNAGYKLPSADNYFKTSFNAGMVTPNSGTVEAFTLLNGMTQAQREQYLDENTLRLYDAFKYNGVGEANVNTAWTKSVTAARQRAELTPEDRKARSKVAKEAVSRLVDPSWYHFGEDDLAGYGLGVIKSEGEKMAMYYPYSPDGLKDKLVAGLRSNPAYTMLGPNVVNNTYPNPVPLEVVMNPGTRPDGKRDVKYTQDQLAAAFHLKVNEIGKRFKVDPDQVSLLRMPDDGGQPRFLMDWGTEKQFITGADLRKLIDDQEVKKWQTKARAQRPEDPQFSIGLASDR